VTLEDRAAMKLYDCEHAIWGVKANLVDETFYKSLVMSAGAFEYYFHVKRFSLSNSIPKKIETECVQKSMKSCTCQTRTSNYTNPSPRHILSSYPDKHCCTVS
jgi:hypothetical protein